VHGGAIRSRAREGPTTPGGSSAGAAHGGELMRSPRGAWLACAEMATTSHASDDSAGIGRHAWCAVAWLGLRSVTMAVVGSAVIGLATFWGSRAGETWDWLWITIVGLTLIAWVGGLGGVFHAVRMGLCLLRWPWRRRAARFKELSIPFMGSGQPCLLLGESGEDVLSVPTWEWRWKALEAYDRREVWFCGRAGGSGVVFLPAKGQALWARRILLPPLRTAFRRRVLGVRGSDQ
jgi:hypothetical protein